MPLQLAINYFQTLRNQYSLYTQTYVSDAIPDLAVFHAFLSDYTITEQLRLPCMF